MDEALLGSLIDKVEDQEKKVEQLEEKVNQQPVAEEVLNRVKTELGGVRADILKISFPEKEMRELSVRLNTSIELLKHPVEQKIVHHHYVSKIILISVGLFLVLCLVLAGWYNTHNKLELYLANDTKYRYLKLEAGPGLRKWMGFIDSLYHGDAKMRDSIIAKEERNQRDLEMLQKAKQMEDEARELKKKVYERATDRSNEKIHASE